MRLWSDCINARDNFLMNDFNGEVENRVLVWLLTFRAPANTSAMPPGRGVMKYADNHKQGRASCGGSWLG